ncbi:MAG: hypothetical protein QOG94_3295 [Solirubrobacteraceae bacterium]|nr:hypothetical protein [Solirubrobacteraceae bacterium]
MNPVGLAPDVSQRRLPLTIAALMAAAALALALLSSPATASADSTVNNCSYAGTNVACIGQINGAPVIVNIGNVASGNNLGVLTAALGGVFANVANISDVNAFAVDLTTQVQTVVNSWVTTTSTVISTVTNTVTTVTKACTVTVAPPAGVPQNSVTTIGCA